LKWTSLQYSQRCKLSVHSSGRSGIRGTDTVYVVVHVATLVLISSSMRFVVSVVVTTGVGPFQWSVTNPASEHATVYTDRRDCVSSLRDARGSIILCECYLLRVSMQPRHVKSTSAYL